MTTGIVLGLLWALTIIVFCAYQWWVWFTETDEAVDIDVSAEWERFVAAEALLAHAAEELYRKQIEEGLK